LLLNNIGSPIGGTPLDKLEFLRRYRFNLAFENEAIPGYTTEKICEAMQARCIPIYWGSSRIHEEFNPLSFVNYMDFPNTEAFVDRIREIDQNDELYMQYLQQPFFHDNVPNEFFDEKRVLDFFERILSTRIEPVGARRSWFQIGRWVLAKKDRPD
jgi:hypothetical protein